MIDQAGWVSFDLYVFDRDELPAGDDAFLRLVEDQSGWTQPLSPRLAAFVAELEAAYPGLDDDPDASPWSSWALSANACAHGSGCSFNIRWSAAEAMSAEIRDRAARHGLLLYDPQTGEVVRPSPADGGERRGLFRWRKRRSP